jgi:hypothetical protein
MCWCFFDMLVFMWVQWPWQWLTKLEYIVCVHTNTTIWLHRCWWVFSICTSPFILYSKCTGHLVCALLSVFLSIFSAHYGYMKEVWLCWKWTVFSRQWSDGCSSQLSDVSTGVSRTTRRRRSKRNKKKDDKWMNEWMKERSNDAPEGDSVNGSHCGEHQCWCELELGTLTRKMHVQCFQ